MKGYIIFAEYDLSSFPGRDPLIFLKPSHIYSKGVILQRHRQMEQLRVCPLKKYSQNKPSDYV